MEFNCLIRFHWDEEASVWTAYSDDVPGLVLESGSFDALLERVRYAVPELLALNNVTPKTIFYTFISERQDKAVLA